MMSFSSSGRRRSLEMGGGGSGLLAMGTQPMAAARAKGNQAATDAMMAPLLESSPLLWGAILSRPQSPSAGDPGRALLILYRSSLSSVRLPCSVSLFPALFLRLTRLSPFFNFPCKSLYCPPPVSQCPPILSVQRPEAILSSSTWN